ncbi:hypothetical protein Tco_0876591 [Tanacetum coccineum]|uniref:Uncharacterized protein n=1 Tax=Tanacetum coccineum TaxID=301880 RepID=A0ABQ5BSS2_9ASTR
MDSQTTQTIKLPILQPVIPLQVFEEKDKEGSVEGTKHLWMAFTLIEHQLKFNLYKMLSMMKAIENSFGCVMALAMIGVTKQKKVQPILLSWLILQQVLLQTLRLGYNVVPLSYTGNFMPPKSDLVYPSLDDFVEVNESVVEKPTVETNEPKTARKENGAPIIEDWVSESEKDDVPKAKSSFLVSVKGNKGEMLLRPQLVGFGKTMAIIADLRIME